MLVQAIANWLGLKGTGLLELFSAIKLKSKLVLLLVKSVTFTWVSLSNS